MKTVDLHAHSTCSDGSMSPRELMLHAKAAGLSAIALTDHDTVDGLEEAALGAKEAEIEFVPGVEFSVVSEAETHIVGLYIDPAEPRFAAALEEIREERRQRNLVTRKLLLELGMDISQEEVRQQAGSRLICRAHFAKVMVNKGYAASVKDAFDRFLGPGRPAFSPTVSLTPEQGIRLIKGAGGVAIAAHVHHIQKEGAALEEYLRELQSYGLDGLEGIYTEYTPEMAVSYQALADKLGLILSGGTDFHGSMKPHIAIGTGTGCLCVPYELLETIKACRG